MRSRFPGMLALVFTLVLVAGACGEGSEKTSESGGEQEGGTISIAGQSANDHGEKDVSGETSLELEADDFYFEPTVLKGAAGESITLEISNESGTLHNFSLTDQAIDQDIPADGSTEVDVTFPDSGTLLFFCKYHQTSGMRGALEVA